LYRYRLRGTAVMGLSPCALGCQTSRHPGVLVSASGSKGRRMPRSKPTQRDASTLPLSDDAAHTTMSPHRVRLMAHPLPGRMTLSATLAGRRMLPCTQDCSDRYGSPQSLLVGPLWRN